MDQLHNDIRNCCNLLDSNKITDRKKGCGDLQDLLQRQDVINLVNSNSEKKDGVTWNMLLLSSHRGLLKEADRIRDDEQKGGKQAAKLENSKFIFCGLITTITNKANTGGVQRLNLGSLLECVLSVFREAFLRKHFGFTFLQILTSKILTCHNYCTMVGEDNWKVKPDIFNPVKSERLAKHNRTLTGLFPVFWCSGCGEADLQSTLFIGAVNNILTDLLHFSEELYHNLPPRVDKSLILSTLTQILRKGSLLSFLTIEVRKKFQFVVDCIKADARSLNLQEPLINLALTLCQVVQFESRIAICRFGEEIMSDFRNLYDYRADGPSNKKDMLVDWFLLQVRAHHPSGAKRGVAASYAHDWQAWIKQLGWLYQLIVTEASRVLRHRSTKQLPNNFISLAVAVCKQIFEVDAREILEMSMVANVTNTSMMEGSAPKRMRLETGVPAVLDKLTSSAQQDMWPWLSLLSALISRRPELMSESDLISLLQFCAEQMQTCRDVTTMENLIRCCNALLFVEGKKDPKLLDTMKLTDLWDSVWETSLRAIGLNLNEEWTHQLVQTLIKETKQVPLDKLLKLFVSGAINRSEHSLATLYWLAVNHCIVNHLSPQQSKVLQEWVLPSREDVPIEDWNSILQCTDLVAKVLTALTLKGKLPHLNSENLVETITDAEKLYLITSFEGGLCTKGKNPNLPKTNNQENNLFSDSELTNHMMTLLTRDHFLAKSRSTTGDNSSSLVHVLALHTGLIFNTILIMKKWDLSVDNRLEVYMNESCDALAESVKGVLISRSDTPTVVAVLRRLADLIRLLAGATDALDLRGFIRRLGTGYVIQACTQLATVSQQAHQPSSDFDFGDLTTSSPSNSEEISPLDSESVVGWSQVQLEAFKTVLEFSRWDEILLSRLLQIPVSNNKEISATCALHMSLSAAKLACSVSCLSVDLLDKLLVVMQSLCRQWHPSDLVTAAILQIFSDMCRHINQSEDEDVHTNYNTLIMALFKYIKRKKYGPHVSCCFVKLLGHIAEVDPAARWSTVVAENGSVRPLTFELITLLSFPFHQVRIAACEEIWTLFSSSGAQLQQQIFEGLVNSVKDIFLIEGALQPSEELDEGVLRTATALHTWAAILTVHSKWRCRALFNIISLSVDKNLNTELVCRVLAVVARELSNVSVSELHSAALPRLVWWWHERAGSLDLFPWVLLGLQPATNLSAIVPALIHRRDTHSLQQLSKNVGQTLPAIIENCYPALLGSILPRFSDERQQQTATIIINVVENYLGEEKVKTLLISKMADVLSCLISNLHDSCDFKTLYVGDKFELPEIFPLNFSANLILGGIKHIQDNSPQTNTPLLVYLSQEKPRLIQKLLLKFYMNVYHAKLPEFKLLSVHQFLTVCELVSVAVQSSHFQLKRYCVTRVVRSLLHIICYPNCPAAVPLAATTALHRFLETTLPAHPHLIDPLLTHITSALVPFARHSSHIGNKAVQVLELVLLSHAKSLPSVASLAPLPDEPALAAAAQQCHRLRYSAPQASSLRAEIQHTLDLQTTSHEALAYLHTKLSGKKTELAALYKELQYTRGFSEDCEQSIMHQLICMLIQATSSSDPKTRFEAACCLGELGPADLTTLGLKPQITASSKKQPLHVFLETVIQYLNKYMFDSDVAVVEMVSDALYSLFCNFSHQFSSILTDEQSELFTPFISLGKKQRKTVTVDKVAIDSLMEFFCPNDLCSHQNWITKLVSAMLFSAQFGCLVPVCQFKVELCNKLLPLIIDVILHISNSNDIYNHFISQINTFFERHSKEISSDEVYGNKDSVLTMLEVVHVIRKHTKEEGKINYLHISKAALFCSAYFTSVMFAELWASENNRDRKHLDTEGLSQLEYIEEQDPEKGQQLQNILREAYMKIGEPDAVYGCGNTHLLDLRTQIQHYQYEGRWQSVVEACDVELSLNPNAQMSGLEEALQYSGLYYLAGRAGTEEACWRLGRWNTVLEQPQSHDRLVCAALAALQCGNTPATLRLVTQARSLLSHDLAAISLEAATNVYPSLSKLRALQEIEDFVNQDFSLVTEKWKAQDDIGCNKFTHVESILAQRIILLKHNQSLNQEACAALLLRACEWARQEGLHTVAHSWLASLRSRYTTLSPQLSGAAQLLQAQIHWDKQQTIMARPILRQLLSKLKDTEFKSLYAKSLHTYGSWVACTRTEQAQQILDKYLCPAVEISDEEFKIVSANSLARYADAEYQSLLNYIKSSAYTSKMKSISESLSSAQKLSKAAEVTKKSADVDRQTKIDIQKSINMHDKQSKIDQTEVENAQRELDNFLILAVRHYLLSLEIGDKDNLSIFRVVSLWLNNYGHSELQEELSQHIDKVPTHKVLPVLPQLAARISDNNAEQSTALLHNLIERCARDHPHHVLPLVLALANSYKDAEYSSSFLQGASKPEARVVGARKMLNSLKQREPLKCMIKDLQKVSEAYISLANCPHNPETSAKVYKIPKTEPITKLTHMANVLCPTIMLPVKKSGDYSNVIGIEGFAETYNSVGGINVPKKITCICTDGIKRPQLVKGNDDLRQDAVMQQVFTIMNSLLHENKETLKRRLLIRTYKVVPLSQRSGVIEWCDNTMPLSTYLIGGGGVVGAHTRYRSQDWPPSICRKKMAEAAKCNNTKKLTVFKEICAHFKPVFHHFFFEKFPNPGVWFERKLAYTHSVATSSMVGYILGLGDRHILNILVDERTAEVIHIDFGIAFEQGRTLVTPETVPFRLTRDVIDGMGVSGVEGVFRRSCEKTMEVLRDYESTIVTILEVLLYDPLYVWTITPAKAIAKQSNKPLQSQPSEGQPERQADKVNKLAERALLRLRQKLQGIEEGSPTSVEGQVSKLIQEATNPINLSRLFNGWQAHV